MTDGMDNLTPAQQEALMMLHAPLDEIYTLDPEEWGVYDDPYTRDEHCAPLSSVLRHLAIDLAASGAVFVGINDACDENELLLIPSDEGARVVLFGDDASGGDDVGAAAFTRTLVTVSGSLGGRDLFTVALERTEALFRRTCDRILALTFPNGTTVQQFIRACGAVPDGGGHFNIHLMYESTPDRLRVELTAFPPPPGNRYDVWEPVTDLEGNVHVDDVINALLLRSEPLPFLPFTMVFPMDRLLPSSDEVRSVALPFIKAAVDSLGLTLKEISDARHGTPAAAPRREGPTPLPAIRSIRSDRALLLDMFARAPQLREKIDSEHRAEIVESPPDATDDIIMLVHDGSPNTVCFDFDDAGMLADVNVVHYEEPRVSLN
jgi:hypothetical protein